MITMTPPDCEITQAHWDWVNRLILDLKIDKLHEDFAEHLDRLVGLYHLFLRSEWMMESLPDEEQAPFHSTHKKTIELIRDLAAQLEDMVIGLGKNDPNLNPRVAAFKSNIERHWQSWYAPVDSEAAQELAARIFHGAA